MSTDAVDYDFVNKELNDEARAIRKDIPMRAEPGALDAYIRCWSEDDVIDGRPCKALVVILKTRGCTWALAGGCTMCGYANESAWQKVSEDQLVTQFERAWKRYDGEELVKIYTSGSFVDRHEVMPEAQERIMRIIGARAAQDHAAASDEATPPTAATSDEATSVAADMQGAGSAGPGGEAAHPDVRPGDNTDAQPAGTTRDHTEAQPADTTRGHSEAQPAGATGDHAGAPAASPEPGPGGKSGPGVRKVAFESLPGFIQHDTFTALAGLVPKLEVGIGVESSNDVVLRDSINKGHGFATFPRAAKVCQEHDVSVKAYLMCKPPYLNESDALRDSTQTIIDAAPHSDVVSLNPTNIQGRTVVDALHKRGSYRAPWLWTLVHAVLEGDRVARGAGFEGTRHPFGDGSTSETTSGGFTGILKSDVIAAGQSRGAHNCGECDERVVGYLKKFKDTQDRRFLQMCLDKVDCPCRKEWELTLELGELVPVYGGL